MIACDIDGTLLDYAYVSGNTVVNKGLIGRLPSSIVLVTNQGGTPFGIAGLLRQDGRPYPKPSDFLARLEFLYKELLRHGVSIEALRVSLYHPSAKRAWIERAATVIREGLRFANVTNDWHVYTTARARKPSALMLNSVGATGYYGDSDEDELAAKAADISFVRINRFYG